MKRPTLLPGIPDMPVRALLMGAAAAMLAACGGDGGDSRASQTPPSAVITAGAAPSGPGMALSFDGSGSRASGGGSLSYQWQLSRRPADSGASLDRNDSQRVMFTPDQPGEYALTLVVTENGRASEAASHVVLVPNPDPVVMIMGDTQRNVLQYAQVMLDAAQSLPPTGGDAGQLRYRWRLVSEPEGEPATDLREANSARPWFIANKLGLYQVELRVEYGERRSDPVTLDIIANAANSTPIAAIQHAAQHMGRPQLKGVVGKAITLDGSASHDPDGDPLQHRWYFRDHYDLPAASKAAIQDASQAVATLVPDFPGTYRVNYVVNDGVVATQPLQVELQVEPDGSPQQAPVLELHDRYRYDGKETEIQCERGGEFCYLSGSVNSNTGLAGITVHAEIWNRRTPEMRKTLSKPVDDSLSFFFEFDTSERGIWDAEIYAEKDGMRSETLKHTVNIRYGANQGPGVSARAVVSNAIVNQPMQFVIERGPGQTRDPNNDKLSFHWFLTDKPDGSSAQVIVTQEGEVATVAPDRPGLYTIGASAIDPQGLFATRPRLASIMVKRHNSPPVIGSDLYVQGKRVSAEQPLIAGRHYTYEVPILDPDNDPLSIIQTHIAPDGERTTHAYREPRQTNGRLRGGIQLPATGQGQLEYLVSDGIETARGHVSYSAIAEDTYPTLLLDEVMPRINDQKNYVHLFFPYQATAFQAGEGTISKILHKATDKISRRYRLQAFDRDYTVQITHQCGDQTHCLHLEGLTDKQKIKKGEAVTFEVQRPYFPDEILTFEERRELSRLDPQNKRLKAIATAAKYPSTISIQVLEQEDFSIEFSTAVK